MKTKTNIDNIALALFFVMLLCVATWKSCTAQLENHRLYKVVQQNGSQHVQGNTNSLVTILGVYGQTSQGTDLVSVIDLNNDSIINQAEIQILLSQWGNDDYAEDESCGNDQYICFLLYLTGIYAGTAWYPTQPFKMILTNSTAREWWWIEGY